MKWRLYKKDDPNTWPQLNIPILVYKKNSTWPEVYQWDNIEHTFIDNLCLYNPKECYYAYISCVPCGHKTHEVTMCVDDSDCRIGCCDNGYCMYDECECEQQRKINEYEIEEKPIWKEFE